VVASNTSQTAATASPFVATTEGAGVLPAWDTIYSTKGGPIIKGSTELGTAESSYLYFCCCWNDSQWSLFQKLNSNPGFLPGMKRMPEVRRLDGALRVWGGM